MSTSTINNNNFLGTSSIPSFTGQSSSQPPPADIEKNVPRPSGKEQNDTLAQSLIEGAQKLERDNKLAEAEKLYLMAFEYTSKSEDYAHLPRLFEKQGSKKQAASAYLVLAELQGKESKQEGVIASLQKSLELAFAFNVKKQLAYLLKSTAKHEEAASCFLELAEQAAYNQDTLNAITFYREAISLCPGNVEAWKALAQVYSNSSEAVKILLEGVKEPLMSLKDRKALCKMALAKEPDSIQVQLLLMTINQLKTKETIKQLKQEIEKLKNPPSVSSERIEVKTIVSPSLPEIAFGKAKWATYFGDVGVEPPLPNDIHQILQSPCPFWPSKKVEETHLLVLIPTSVDGKPFTLQLLGELIQKPKQGTATEYNRLHLGLNEYQDIPVPQSYWALMTRDVIKRSRSKSYSAQKELVSSYRQKTGISYELPKVLEAATCILMHHVSGGQRLYVNTPLTYTRCQELWDVKNGGNPMVVGGFDASGLHLFGSRIDKGDNFGMGCVRRVS